MEKDALSQEEMDALLGEEATEKEEIATLSKEEKGNLLRVLNQVAVALSKSLTNILNRQVAITSPKISVTMSEDLKEELPSPSILIEVSYSQGLIGSSYFILFKRDGAVVADLVMGSDGTSPPEEINELYLGALNETWVKVFGESSTALSKAFGRAVMVGVPRVTLVDFKLGEVVPVLEGENPVISVDYNFVVEGLVQSKLLQAIPFDLARTMASMQPAAAQPTTTPSTGAPGVHPVQFGVLKEAPPAERELPANISLLMDVPMQVTVELGRTQMLLKDILELGTGSIVELDKLAGEPVDLLVNGKLVAKGGVVVIEENFGIRITDIVAPAERVSTLKK
jgi:flagellar motor switch protein FliN/FliY